MTANGSGPAAVATAVEARKIDQIGGLIDPEGNATPRATQRNGFYSASTIKPKRHRRTKTAVASIRDTLKDILEQSHPRAAGLLRAHRQGRDRQDRGRISPARHDRLLV